MSMPSTTEYPAARFLSRQVVTLFQPPWEGRRDPAKPDEDTMLISGRFLRVLLATRCIRQGRMFQLILEKMTNQPLTRIGGHGPPYLSSRRL